MSIDSNTPHSAPVRRDRLVTILLTIYCQSFQAVSAGGIALLLPIIRQDLGLNFTQGGSLAAVATIVYALMQIPVGYLTDRFSPKRLFALGILCTSVLTLTFGLTTNYWQALVNQAFSGAARALLFAPGMTLLAGWFPPNRRATAMGIYLLGGTTGSVIFNIVGPLIVAVADWRIAFISISSLGIVSTFILLRFGKESPTQPVRRKENILQAFQLFRYRVMWYCGILQFIRFGTIQGITYWLPSLLINERGLPLQYTGFIIAAQVILIASSNVLGGYLSDRLRNPILVINVALIVLGITTVLLVHTSLPALTIAIILVNAAFLQMYFGPLFSIPVDILGVRKAGVSTGFSNFFASVGGFSATYLLGALKDATGAFRYGFYIIAGACFIGLIFSLALARLKTKPLVLEDSTNQ